MTHSFDGYNDLIRLARGERLSEALEQFFNDTKLPGAWVNGLGASSEITLGYFNPHTKKYQWQTITQDLEVLSLTGNFTHDEAGKMMYHLHGVFGDDDYKTIGGHVKDLVAGATLELFVHRTYQPVRRAHDQDTGLQLLDLEK
jgi:predicted DNA-binding protein with PD1-like motif